MTDIAPSSTFTNAVTANTFSFGNQMTIRTSSTGTIAARSNTATVDAYFAQTIGFKWARK